eukprot:10784692-Prorocentrum_lima.AAC.1
MTSSLVGSEMCIRDRVCFNSKPLQKLSLDDWQQLEDSPLPCSAMRATSVSYTHLTLPTICSV